MCIRDRAKAVKTAAAPAPAAERKARVTKKPAAPKAAPATPAAAQTQAAPSAAKSAAKPVKAEKPVKETKPAVKDKKAKKAKLVRDSFTIPKDEYAALETLKQRALGLGLAIKKSEILRAGLLALNAQADAALLKTLQSVPTLKTGRPAKSE